MDDYGIPVQLFGEVDERFYSGLGRVVMLASLLDDMLVRLRQSLAHEFQSVSAGKFGEDVRDACTGAAEHVPDDLKKEVLALVKEARRLHAQRNRYVHGIWAQPSLEKGLAWMAKLEQPYEARTEIEWFEVDEAKIRKDIDGFAKMIKKLVLLIKRLDQLQWKGHAEKANRLTQG